MDTLRQDLRYAVRQLTRASGHTAVVVLTLAVGIGATTTIFSAVDTVLLRPLPFTDSHRLVMVWEEHAEDAASNGPVAPASVYEWRDQVGVFRDVAAYGRTGVTTLVDEGVPEALTAVWVTGNFFDVLGLRPGHGRALRDEETWSDASPVVVLSDRLWARRFGRDPDIIGSVLLIGEVPREVVGIVPPGAEFPDREVDLWLPLGWNPAAHEQQWFRTERFLRVIARLEDGVSVEQADAALQTVVERTREEYTDRRHAVRTGTTPLQKFLVAEARTPLLILFGSTVLLLLLACANVANLVLVRASGRGSELALRSALGAGRGRIARQLLVESIVLALAGGAAGLAVGILGIRLLGSLSPLNALHVSDLSVDARILLFSLAVTLASGIISGIAPALRGAATQAATALKEGTRATGGRGRHRASELLVVAEVALAVLLVTGAGLLLRSYVALRQVDPGFRIDDRVAAMVVLPQRYDADPKILGFVDEVVTRFTRIPGVAAVTYMARLPLSGTITTPTDETVTIEGRGTIGSGRALGRRLVGPSYFEVLGVPLLRGREFEDADDDASEPVIVINREAVRQLFLDQDPIGRRITWDPNPGPESTWYRIVGVVGNEHQHGVRAPPQMEAFFPFRAIPSAFVSFVLHKPGNSTPIGEAIRAEIASIDPLLPLFELRSLEQVYATALGRDRFLLMLIGAFAFVAVLLATVGVFGVTAEAASRRTHEIGVRMAVGARARNVVGLVLGRALALAGAGIGAGLLLALGTTRVLDAMLYGVPPVDPITFLVVPAVIMAAALMAGLLPARRATGVDPVTALRAE